MLCYSNGSETMDLAPQELKEGLYEALNTIGNKRKVLVLPPDITRYHSKAGELTRYAYDYYRQKITHLLPALGTHNPMNATEITRMFKGIPLSLFHIHDWRNDIINIGKVPADFIHEVSGGLVHYDWEVQVNKLLLQEGFDLILSVGQVVPHEVTGMANFNKNIFIGTGGPEAINKSHFLGAVFGLEKIMGQKDTPVRKVLNYAWDKFADRFPMVLHILTVIGRKTDGRLAVRGLYIGDDLECFNRASELSQQVNIEMLDTPLKKCVVYLDPSEYKSTWLGNKAIYRTRMAMADGGELIILAPGLQQFGEDPEIDTLIRKYGYKGTSATLEAVKKQKELQHNLSAAAHLIHGSSEERFQITYCPGILSEEEVRAVNFNYANINEMMKIYNPETRKDGYNQMPYDEEIFYISNPGLGLWSTKHNF